VGKTNRVVETELGVFPIIRKDAIAITVVKVRRKVRHHRKWLDRDDITHVEHRKIPSYRSKVVSNSGGWNEIIATYTLDGKRIKLADI